MEAGNRTAGDSDEENWEQWLASYLKANECRHVNGRSCNNNTQNAACNHTKKQEGAKVVTRLHKEPHRKYRCYEAVSEGNITPYSCIEVKWEVHADSKHCNNKYHSNSQLNTAGRVATSDVLAKAHCYEDVQHGNACCLSSRNIQAAVLCKASEGICKDISKCCNNQQGEEPAEKKEQTASHLAYILFNKHTHGLAFVLNGSIQCCKVLNSAEEYAAQKNPQECWQPAIHCCDDRSGYRACASN